MLVNSIISVLTKTKNVDQELNNDNLIGDSNKDKNTLRSHKQQLSGHENKINTINQLRAYTDSNYNYTSKRVNCPNGKNNCNN